MAVHSGVALARLPHPWLTPPSSTQGTLQKSLEHLRKQMEDALVFQAQAEETLTLWQASGGPLPWAAWALWDSGGRGHTGTSQMTARLLPQKMIESQRQNVAGEFERLRRLLEEDERRLLQALEAEELEALPPLRESVARLGQQSTQLAQLISELEGRCQLPALGLLQVS